MNPFEVPMSPRNPPCSETVAPLQKHSLPVSNKTEMHETNHTEGQLFEKRVQKVCSNPEVGEGGGPHFKLAFHFCFFPSSWKRNSTSKSCRTELLVL